MPSSPHPLWLVGFRPFFALACLSGLSLPILWVLLLDGVISPPAAPFSIIQWHAHEMFFGFGWAVLGGFLLTSTKNWVQIRGYHGRPLMFLVAAWLFERIAMWYGGNWPAAVFFVATNLFLGSIVAMLAWTLFRHRQTDSYRDNYFFLLILPAFLLAKHLLLDSEAFALGSSMTIGLFRMAFLVMLERTLTQFMKGVFQVDILRNASLDQAIKICALLLVGESLLPASIAAGLALLLAGLLAIRFAFWQPLLAVRRLDIGIMYLGYLCLTGQLLLLAADHLLAPAWIGSVSIHTFTFGVMGLIVPAMLIRIAKGHTGRKVVFERLDKLALWLMIAGLLLRVVAPQFFPAAYPRWLEMAASCWFACFGLLGWRFIPWLCQARVDGKTH